MYPIDLEILEVLRGSEPLGAMEIRKALKTYRYDNTVAQSLWRLRRAKRVKRLPGKTPRPDSLGRPHRVPVYEVIVGPPPKK